MINDAYIVSHVSLLAIQVIMELGLQVKNTDSQVWNDAKTISRAALSKCFQIEEPKKRMSTKPRMIYRLHHPRSRRAATVFTVNLCVRMNPVYTWWPSFPCGNQQEMRNFVHRWNPLLCTLRKAEWCDPCCCPNETKREEQPRPVWIDSHSTHRVDIKGNFEQWKESDK